MEISNRKTGFVLFIDLCKELNSRTRDFGLMKTTMHHERKSQVTCSGKTERHLSKIQYLMKRTQQ